MKDNIVATRTTVTKKLGYLVNLWHQYIPFYSMVHSFFVTEEEKP